MTPRSRAIRSALRRRSNTRLYRQATAIAIVGAPLLFLAANVVHPQEYKHDHEREQLAEVAANYTSWQIAHLLTFACIVVFAAAIVGLAYLVGRRQPRLGLIAGALAIAGLLGLAFVDALDGYTWGVLGEVSTHRGADPGTVQLALHDVQQSTWSLPYYLTPLAWIAGLVVLTLAAGRQRALPQPASILFALGVVLVGLEAAVADNTYFIVASSVLTLGGAAMAAALWRMPDDAFLKRV